MNRRLLLVTATLVIASGMTAQTAQPPDLHRPKTLRGETMFFGFGPAGTLITPKRHAPFSALIVESMQQTLNDGTNIEAAKRRNRDAGRPRADLSRAKDRQAAARTPSTSRRAANRAAASNGYHHH